MLRRETRNEKLFEGDLHAKRIGALTSATAGALAAGRLGVHAIGIGLAEVRGLRQKHTIKQVDRLLSNPLPAVVSVARDGSKPVRQGILYYNQIPNMPEDRLTPLINRFAEVLAQPPLCRAVFEIL